MEHYVTLFDSLFLPQGLALHGSLQRHAGDHTLWILCMDERAHEVLQRLNLPNTRLIALADVETTELKRVKPLRTRGEYCWTITPFTPAFVFDRDSSVQRVTYVDADLWFRAAPTLLLAGFGASGKAVQITEHAFAPEYDFAATNGIYCVQFMTFVRDRSDPIRRWWADRCIEWCFGRLEDGKFGDQKYLDDWTVRFAADVHVLHSPEALQGPWNACRFSPSQAIGYHFHGLRLLGDDRVLTAEKYKLPRPTRELLYDAYLHDFAGAVNSLRAAGHTPPPQLSGRWWSIALRERARRAGASIREALHRRVVRLQ